MTLELKPKHTCPVCGYQMSRPPVDFSICPSCGTEFGYQDVGASFAELRKEWIGSGANWHSEVETQPKDWNPYLQLISAGLVDIKLGDSENLTITLETGGEAKAESGSQISARAVRTASREVGTVVA